MGTGKSKPEDVNTQFVNHPKFNEVVVVDKNNQKYIQLQLPVHAQREVRDWQRQLKNLADFNKENLLLAESHDFQKEGLCGSTGIVKILYQNYPYLLTDEIYNRKGLSKLFDESEIWYLLYTAVSAAKDFQKAKIKLGDIRPQNIFINEDGQVKLANVYSWPNEDNNYMKTVLNNQPTYIAPEEVNELQNGKHDNKCDPNIAQAFSIGLTIIDAGLLGDASKLYNFKSQKFDEAKAKELFNEWSNSYYSDFLKRTVLSLVELDPKNRSTPAEVYSKLQPYEEDIKNLKEFASSVQGSPNRPFDNRPIQGENLGPYQEGSYLNKPQFVPEQVGAGDYHYSTTTGPSTISYYNQPVNTFVPGHTTTTYTGQVGATSHTQPTSFTAPVTYPAGTYGAKPYPSGNISTGINALNPSSYYTTSVGSSIPYQYPYQPSTIVTSNFPTSNTGITTRPYEVLNPNALQGTSSNTYTSNLPPITGYQSSSATTTVGNPVTFTSAQPIYSGTTGLPSSTTAPYTGGISTYTHSYYPTSSATPESFVSRPPQYVYTNSIQQSSDGNNNGVPNSAGLHSGQTSSTAKLGTISTSGVGNGVSQLGEAKKQETATTTITHIVNGQPITTTDVQRMESTSQDGITNTRKDLNDARQVSSILPPSQY